MAITSSIQAKFALIIGVFVLAMGMTAGATLYVAETQTFDAAVIDVAARQPLLATEMAAGTQELVAALESESSVKQAREALDQRAQLFGHSLSALHDGGEIAVAEGDTITLPPSEGAAREALDRTLAAWTPYRRTLDVLLAPDVDVTSDAFYEATDALAGQESEIRAAATAAVHPLKEGSQAKVALMKRVVWLSIIATLIVAAASWVFTHRKVLTPVRQLARTIRSIEQTSDLSQRLEVGSRDEIGHAADAFNRMLATFQQMVNEVAGTVDQLEGAAANLSDVTECSRRSMEMQQSDIEKVASAMHELEMSAGDVVHNTDAAATSAENVNRDAEEGSAVVERTMDSIRALAESVRRAADVMHNLEQDTTGIGSILDVIRGISEQTNLLALNAAIEAARAGEQGRGFAVVADEVRVLAQRTQSSTQEIQDMIERLQSGATDVAQVMEEGRARVEKSVEQAAQTREALAHITDAVTSMSDMNRQIASAAREQGTVTGDLSQNIVRIKEEADETAVAAERTASAGTLLAEKAGHLKSLVSRFKV